MSRLRALRILPLLLAAVVAGGAAGAVEARPVATAPNDAAMEKLRPASRPTCSPSVRMRANLAQVGPERVRSERDFSRVALPNGDADVLRDLLLQKQPAVVLEIED